MVDINETTDLYNNDHMIIILALAYSSSIEIQDALLYYGYAYQQYQ